MNRLLIAELRRMWRQGLAISILLGCGIALFVMTNSSMLSLKVARQEYYTQYQFGEVFASLVRAPNQLVNRISEIEGVQRVQARIVRNVLLDIPEMAEPASCLLVSIDSRDPYPMNAIHLTRGRFPDDNDRSETVVSELFAEAHRIRPGDSLDVIMGGRKQRLQIVGVGLSPEFVYVVQPGLLITDNRRYGVVWMPRRQMEAAFNMEGAFNSLSITLQPRANVTAVISGVDRLTRPYGGTGAYDREDQDSHHRVADEMTQQKTMALVMPSIFLAVSAFLFNIVFTRLVNQQTEQIATLRAFGYRSSEIGWHYVKMVLFWVFLGSAFGCVLGVRLSWWMTAQYLRFFRFPTIEYEFATQHATLAVVIGCIAAILGTFAAIRQAMSLQPAEAMRPSAPKDYRGLIAERTGISTLLSPVGRMIVRRLETNPLSTSLSVMGMALGVAILILGSFFQDTIDYVTDLQFNKVQRQDVMLTFVDTLSASAVHDVAHLPGVTLVEPFRSVAVKMRSGTRSYRLALMGLDASPTLYRVLDSAERDVALPRFGGLTISEKLAEVLDVKLGENITVEILDRDQKTLEIPVGRIFPNYTDPTAYLNRYDLHEILNEVEQLSGSFVSVERDSMDKLYAAVKQAPSIAGVLDKHAAKASFEETINESTSLMRVVNSVFSVAIAFGVIYNCAVIILAERARDLATLRVMGFRRREVSMVLVGELAIITLLSIPVGVPIGIGFAYLARVRVSIAAHSQSITTVDRAKEAIELAKQDFDRAEKLVASRAISQAEHDAIENRLRLAYADLRTAESAERVAGYEIDQARTAVDYVSSTFDPNEEHLFKVVSPINGRVLEVYREDSGFITSGTPIVRIGDASDMEIVIDVLSTDAVKVSPHDKVIVEHWGGDKPLAAVVRLVEPSAFLKVSALGVEEKRVNVIADFVDPFPDRNSIGDGFRIEAKIVVDETPAECLKVPAGVLFRQSNAWHAFRIADGIAERIEVQVGRSNGRETEILAGMRKDDLLIQHPNESVQPGAKLSSLPNSASE